MAAPRLRQPGFQGRRRLLAAAVERRYGDREGLATTLPAHHRLLQQDLALRVAGDADGQPAHEAHVDVGVDLQAELADVEVKGLVLVEDVYLRMRDGVEHVHHATGRAGRKLIQNCSAGGRYGQ